MASISQWSRCVVVVPILLFANCLLHLHVDVDRTVVAVVVLTLMPFDADDTILRCHCLWWWWVGRAVVLFMELIL